MPRKLKNSKKYIVVACEGESEQAYASFFENGASFYFILLLHNMIKSKRIFEG